MRLPTAVAVLTALFCSTAVDASRLTPSVLPLIVRNPYLSNWLPNARTEPWTDWPMHWIGEHQGFSVLASLPGQRMAFPLLGRPHDSLDPRETAYNISYPKYRGASYDASTTNLSYTVHDPDHESQSVDITLSFLSPITPSSTFRQSIPASYLTVYVSGNIEIDIYIDVNGQWVSGDRGSKIVWELQNTTIDAEHPGLKTWMVKREVEQLFTEFRQQAEWGTLYFSGPADVNHASGVSARLRKHFCRTGALENKVSSRFRGIMEDEPVFAFSKSFGISKPSSVAGKHYKETITFTIAHIQNPVVQYAAARGLTYMRPLWASYIPDVSKLLAFHYKDFHHAKELADRYSAQLAKDAFESGSENYVDIVALSARQVMATTHFLGTPDDPLLFLKEIQSAGNVQTVDIIFPAFPFFLYTNPRWLAYLLEPILEHVLSGQYPNKYTPHDIGASYPNATGHPDGRDEYMPVEESGNILIMALALANAMKYSANISTSSSWLPMSEFALPCSGEREGILKPFPLIVGQENGMLYLDDAWMGTTEVEERAQKWVGRSYRLWEQWTAYLVEFALEPANQLTTDDFAGWIALATNLALKGIIGIKAMAGLSTVVGHESDARRYNEIANDYIAKWEVFGISRDKTHAKVSYNWYGSWTTIYNLYADALLCFHMTPNSDKLSGWSSSGPHGIQRPVKHHQDQVGFVPHHIYQMQSDWYFNVRQKYGVPLDSRRLWAKSDWEFWSMSVAAPGVRATILELIAKWVNETNIDRPLSDLYDTENEGGYPGVNFFARPAVGGHFAFLSLERACGGKAMDGLRFLNDDITKGESVDVARILQREADEAGPAISYEL